MTVKVLLFGPFAAAAGTPQWSVPLGADRSSAAVLRGLGDACPALRPMLTGSRLAVNARFAPPETPVVETDELAVIGLVSGG